MIERELLLRWLKSMRNNVGNFPGRDEKFKAGEIQAYDSLITLINDGYFIKH